MIILLVSRLPCHSSRQDKWVFYFTSLLYTIHKSYQRSYILMLAGDQGPHSYSVSSPSGGGGNNWMSKWIEIKTVNVHASKTKQRINSPLPLGRRCSAPPGNPRLHDTEWWLWKAKAITLNVLPSSFLELYVLGMTPHDVGYPLDQLRSPVLAVSPSDFLCIPSSLMWWCRGKKPFVLCKHWSAITKLLYSYHDFQHKS